MALLASAASAADLMPAPVSSGNFYVGAFGGATWFTENGADFTIADDFPDIDYAGESGEVSLDTDTGFLVGGVLGYRWGDSGLRSELEVSYSQANLDGFDIDFDDSGIPDLDGDDVDFDGDVSVTYIMGNLWYDFGGMMDMGGISPYIGGGLGVGFANYDVDAIEGVDVDADGSETGFAYQLGGGLLWNVSDSFALDLGYRWRGVTLADYEDDLNSHNVLLGVTVGF